MVALGALVIDGALQVGRILAQAQPLRLGKQFLMGYLGLVSATPGSEQELQAQALMDSEDHGYKAALLSTLARTRTLAEEGNL